MSRLVTPLPSALAHAPLQIPCSFAVTLPCACRETETLTCISTLTKLQSYGTRSQGRGAVACLLHKLKHTFALLSRL